MKNETNIYLVNLTIYIGGYEKNIIHLIEAADETEAGRRAMEDESHDPETLEFDGDYQATDMGGEFVYKVSFVKEVDWKDAVILRKYL